MAKSKLKAALDNYQGRNIKLEKQRKHEKQAHKQKEKRQAEKAEENGEEDTEEGGVPVPLDEVEVKVNGKTKKSKKDKKTDAKPAKAAPAVKEPEWETDEEDDDDASDDDDAPEDAQMRREMQELEVDPVRRTARASVPTTRWSTRCRTPSGGSRRTWCR